MFPFTHSDLSYKRAGFQFIECSFHPCHKPVKNHRNPPDKKLKHCCALNHTLCCMIVCASSNPPSVLCGIPLSGQPEQMQDPYALFGLAPLGSAFSFHSYEPQAIHHHQYPIAGYLFCPVASCLQLIIANSSACNEGGVSSLSSNPRASSHLCLIILSILS
jgi:hypothetical protein